MADKIKKIKIKYDDGTYSEYIPIGADAKNVDLKNGKSVEKAIHEKPYYYNSVAEMVDDSSLNLGDCAMTLGYYEANDGGAATYKIVGSSSNLTTKISNGLYAELIIKDMINVKQFGAKGNGITDDYEAVQKALLQKGTLYFPIGTFCFNRPITIAANINGISAIKMERGTIIKATNFMDALFKLHGSLTNFIFEGGYLECDSKASRGIWTIDYMSSPTFKDIFIHNATTCGLQIRSDRSGDSGHGYMDRIKVYNNDTLATCIEIHDHDFQLTDCELFYTRCGVNLQSEMHILNGIHVWAGGNKNTGIDNYGIICNGHNGNGFIGHNLYLDGCNYGIYSKKGRNLITNLYFYCPSEGVYSTPVAFLADDNTSTSWDISNYFYKVDKPNTKGVVMAYKNMDFNNMIQNTKCKTWHYHDKETNKNILDPGRDIYIADKSIAYPIASYTQTWISGKYALIGYIWLRTSPKVQLGFQVNDSANGIGKKCYARLEYNSGTNVATVLDSYTEDVFRNTGNASINFVVGKPVIKQDACGNSIPVLPLYIYYNGEATNFQSSSAISLSPITGMNPGVFEVFPTEGFNLDISGGNILTTFNCGKNT